jgi:hypothetical protein
MTTYVMRDGKLVECDLAGPPAGGTSPYVISDEMAPTRHMADLGMYTSKAKFRAATRAHGCVEVGNETATLLKPRKSAQLDRGQRRDAIRQAIHQLKEGRRV